jgi:hypothetical protein
LQCAHLWSLKIRNVSVSAKKMQIIYPYNLLVSGLLLCIATSGNIAICIYCYIM